MRAGPTRRLAARRREDSFRGNVHQAVPLMRDVFRRRLEAIRAASRDVELRGRLQTFSDRHHPRRLRVQDRRRPVATSDPGTSQSAEPKLHAVYCVRAGGCSSVTMAKGSEHDSDGFWPTSWEKNALYLWDLGYVSNERFIDAVQSGAHVVQRLKDTMNPVVLASYGPGGTRRESLDEDGRRIRLQDACAFGRVHKQPVLDLDVEIKDNKGRVVQARVVCVPFGGQDRYYLTTLRARSSRPRHRRAVSDPLGGGGLLPRMARRDEPRRSATPQPSAVARSHHPGLAARRGPRPADYDRAPTARRRGSRPTGGFFPLSEAPPKRRPSARSSRSRCNSPAPSRAWSTWPSAWPKATMRASVALPAPWPMPCSTVRAIAGPARSCAR